MTSKNPPPGDDDFDWLSSAPLDDDDANLFGTSASENVHGGRERDEGIGQAQYGKVVRRRMEDTMQQAEDAEFGDLEGTLDWVASPESSEADLPEWLRGMSIPEVSEDAVAEARASLLQAPPEAPAASWLAGLTFEAPDAGTDWIEKTDTGPLRDDANAPEWIPRTGFTDTLGGDEGGTPAWVARTGDTDNLPQADSSAPDWLRKVGMTGDLRDIRASFMGKPPTGDLSLDEFGLAGVEPLRTEEVPMVRSDQLSGIFDDFSSLESFDFPDDDSRQFDSEFDTGAFNAALGFPTAPPETPAAPSSALKSLKRPSAPPPINAVTDENAFGFDTFDQFSVDADRFDFSALAPDTDDDLLDTDQFDSAQIALFANAVSNPLTSDDDDPFDFSAFDDVPNYEGAVQPLDTNRFDPADAFDFSMIDDLPGVAGDVQPLDSDLLDFSVDLPQAGAALKDNAFDFSVFDDFPPQSGDVQPLDSDLLDFSVDLPQSVSSLMANADDSAFDFSLFDDLPLEDDDVQPLDTTLYSPEELSGVPYADTERYDDSPDTNDNDFFDAFGRQAAALDSDGARDFFDFDVPGGFEAASSLPRADLASFGQDMDDSQPSEILTPNAVPDWLQDAKPASTANPQLNAAAFDSLFDTPAAPTLGGSAPDWLSRLGNEDRSADLNVVAFGEGNFGYGSDASDDFPNFFDNSDDEAFDSTLYDPASFDLEPQAGIGGDLFDMSIFDNADTPADEGDGGLGELFDSQSFDAAVLSEIRESIAPKPVPAPAAAFFDDDLFPAGALSDTPDFFGQEYDADLFDMNYLSDLERMPANASDPDGDLDALMTSGAFDSAVIAPIGGDKPIRTRNFEEVFGTDSRPMDAPRDGDALVRQTALPSWLSQDQQENVAGLSAELRKRQDSPLDDMDDRLLALRDEGLSLVVEENVNSGLMMQILPGVADVLAPVAMTTGSAAAMGTALVISPDQEKRAALLTALLEGERSTENRRHVGFRINVAQLAVAIVLLIAVLLPFLTPNFSVGAPPAGVFAPDSPAAAAFNSIAGVSSGSPVLIALEYGAASAPELDSLMLTTLRHLRQRGAVPVIISTNAVGILRAESLLAQGFPNGANRDYYVTSFIPAGAVGLRDLTSDPRMIFAADARGNANGLVIERLEDFTLGILISDNAEVVRNYMEQVVSRTSLRFTLATSYSSLPFVLPYVTSGQVTGALVGYQDAVNYALILDGGVPLPALPTTDATDAVAPAITPTDVPTDTSPTDATPAPSATLVLSATASDTRATTDSALVPPNATADGTALATRTAVAPLPPTATVLPPTATATNTPSPTVTSSATARPTSTATITPEPTVLIGTIISDGAINVRSRATSNSTPIGVLNSGDIVRVLNFNDDQTWVSVVLADAQVGWVAAFLITVEEKPLSQTPFNKIPARMQQATPPAPDGTVETVQIGTIIVEGPLQVLDAPRATGAVIAQVNQGDQFRVLIVEGDYASLVLSDNRIGYIETFTLAIAEQPLAALTNLQVSTPVAAPTRRPTTPALTATATDLPATATNSAATMTQIPPTALPTLSAPQASATVAHGDDARWQSQALGLGVAIGLIVVGNLYYLLRAGVRGRRR